MIPASSVLVRTLLPVLFIAVQSAAATEVLIYYANETAPDGEELANYHQFEEWLRRTDSERARTAAAGLKRDRTMFQQAVDEEIGIIETVATESEPDLKILIVTNRLARKGKALFFDPRNGWSDVDADFVSPEDYILDSNRLANLENLQAVLVLAAELCTPASHRFVLISKSHGSKDKALQVTLARRHEDVSYEQVARSFEERNDGTLLEVADYGVSRSDFLATLSDAGRKHQVQFSLVFMESCQGQLDAGLAENLPQNVDRLVASGDRYLGYRTLDYEALLKGVQADQSLTMRLNEFVEPRYQVAYRQVVSSPFRWLWILPLILAGLYLATRIATFLRAR